MEIEYKGGNCVVITYKKNSFVVDPKLSNIGLKDQGNSTIQLLTQQRFGADHSDDTLVLSSPGEYEVQNCSVKGIAARPHTAQEDAAPTVTIYRLGIDDISVAILGHIAPKLSESQLETLGVIDVLIIPVGGYGYSIEPKEAVEIVRSIEPKIIIPTHYAQEGVNYEVPQAELVEFVKEMGLTPQEPQAKLKLKPTQLPDTPTLQEITRTK